MKIRIIKKTVDKDLADFLEEFSYYKKEGVGYNLSDEDLKQRFNSVKASTDGRASRSTLLPSTTPLTNILAAIRFSGGISTLLISSNNVSRCINLLTT